MDIPHLASGLPHDLVTWHWLRINTGSAQLHQFTVRECLDILIYLVSDSLMIDPAYRPGHSINAPSNFLPRFSYLSPIAPRISGKRTSRAVLYQTSSKPSLSPSMQFLYACFLDMGNFMGCRDWTPFSFVGKSRRSLVWVYRELCDIHHADGCHAAISFLQYQSIRYRSKADTIQDDDDYVSTRKKR